MRQETTEAKAPIGHLPSGAPWDTLAIDFLGPLPVTERGNQYIMVATDHFTKYVEVIAVPTLSANDCALKIANEFIARWGAPLSIHTDMGSTFESAIFQALCKLFEIRKTRTTPRNPKGNGQTERFNRTLVKMIKAYLVNQDEWDLYLGCLAGAYRSTPHEATGLSPNLMCLGREVRVPADLVYGFAKGKEQTSDAKYVSSIRAHLQKAHEIARKHMKANAKRSKDAYDVKTVFHTYNVGDAVWLLHESRTVGVMQKLIQ